jgi:hypothetical protein
MSQAFFRSFTCVLFLVASFAVTAAPVSLPRGVSQMAQVEGITEYA